MGIRWHVLALPLYSCVIVIDNKKKKSQFIISYGDLYKLNAWQICVFSSPSSGVELPDPGPDDGLKSGSIPTERWLWLYFETCHHERRDRLFQCQYKGCDTWSVTANTSYQSK